MKMDAGSNGMIIVLDKQTEPDENFLEECTYYYVKCVYMSFGYFHL